MLPLGGCLDAGTLRNELHDLQEQVGQLERQTPQTAADSAESLQQSKAALQNATSSQQAANRALSEARTAQLMLDASFERIDRSFKRSVADEPPPVHHKKHKSSSGHFDAGAVGHAGADGPGQTASPPKSKPGASPTPGETADPFAAVDGLLSQLKPGQIAFNVPETMSLDDTAEIHLLLSLKTNTAALEQLIHASGDKVSATIHVSDRMEARLTGVNFEITAITPEDQPVSETQNTGWQWEVKPKSAGAQELHLTLSAILEVDGAQSQRSIQTFDRTINVKVYWYKSLGAWFKNNWQWLWTALLLPLAGWLWRRYKKRPAVSAAATRQDRQ
jgi:hypothetical protein